MAVPNLANGWTSTTTTSLTSGATTVDVASTSGIPTRPFQAVLLGIFPNGATDTGNTDEIVTVTGLSGSTLTISRHTEPNSTGSSAGSAHSTGVIISHVLTKQNLTDLVNNSMPLPVQNVSHYQATSTTNVVTVSAPTSGNVLIGLVGAVSRGATSITQTNVTWTQSLTSNGNSVYTEIWFGVITGSPGTTATFNFASSTTSSCAVIELPGDSTPAFTSHGTASTVTGATGTVVSVPDLACNPGDWIVWVGAGNASASSYSSANMSYVPVSAFGGTLRGGIAKSKGNLFSVYTIQVASVAYNQLSVVIS